VIVDCHCHAGLGDGLTGPWDTEAHLDKYLRRAQSAGITRTVVFPTFHSDYAVANRELARIVEGSRERLLGFAFVHSSRDKGRVRELVREAVERYGFCGIKVHRFDARITREVCEAARVYSIPILYDVMGEVSVIELVAREYRDVNFIVPHLGSFADDFRAQTAMIGVVLRHPNVFTDSSAVRRFDLLAEVATRAWPKLLFGSDGPWLHPGIELAKIRALRLPEYAERYVLGLTLLRLLSPALKARLMPRAPRLVSVPA